MKKLVIFFFILLPAFSMAQSGGWNPVIFGKQNFKDSLRLLKYKNNFAKDSVLTTDSSGRVIMKLAGGITGSGTLNYIPKWTPDGVALGNSSATDNGSLFTINNPLKIVDGSQGTGKVFTSDNNGLGTWATPAIYTSSNGITKTGSDFKLGGTLSGNTTITGTQSDIMQFDGPTFKSWLYPISGQNNILSNNFSGLGMVCTPDYGIGYGSGLFINNDRVANQNISGIPIKKWSALMYTQLNTSKNQYILLDSNHVKIKADSVSIDIASKGAGKVLTSDANGLATWETPSAGGIITATAPLYVSGSNVYADTSKSVGKLATYSDVQGKVSGSGTLNYIPKWTPSGVALGNSQIFENGTNVGIGITTPLATLHVGNLNVNNSVDASILGSRNIVDAGGMSGINAHEFSSSSNVNRSGNVGYAPFDARYTVSGSYNYDHFADFQSAPVIGTSGTTSELYGFYSGGTINLGSLVSRYGLHVADMTGSGTIGNNYGLKIKALTKGTQNYGVYVEANNSYFNGQVQIGYNTPAYLSAPTDGELKITMGGTDKNFTVTPSGIGIIELQGNVESTAGYFYSNRFATPAFVINTSGSKYGQIFSNGANAFSLGYNTTKGTTGTAALSWTNTGNVGIGTATPAASSLLDIPSTTGGILIPRMNTTQQNAISSPANGLMIYNTDSSDNVVYKSSAWRIAGSAGGGGGWGTTGTVATQTGNARLNAATFGFGIDNADTILLQATNGVLIPEAKGLGLYQQDLASYGYLTGGNGDASGGLNYDATGAGFNITHLQFAETSTDRFYRFPNYDGIVAILNKDTATLDFPSTAAGTVSDLTVLATGAELGDVVVIGAPNGSMPAAGTYFAWVSAADTVTVRYANNALVTSYNPASGTFKVSVLK